MISNEYNIHDFVEAVRDKDPWQVVILAIEEADRVDRLMYRKDRYSPEQLQSGKLYSHQLKQLIDYIRYESKPHRSKNIAYQLYRANWGSPGKTLRAY